MQAPPDRPETTESHPLGGRLPREESWLRAVLQRAGARGAALDDAIQETFARAWRSRDGYSPDRPLRPWLRSTALRAWIDLRRREARQPESFDEHDPIDSRRAGPTEVDDRLDLATLLTTALPGPERDILDRFHRQGQPIRRIAELLGMPENTVKSHLHRARRRLAAALAEPRSGPGTPADARRRTEEVEP